MISLNYNHTINHPLGHQQAEINMFISPNEVGSIFQCLQSCWKSAASYLKVATDKWKVGFRTVQKSIEVNPKVAFGQSEFRSGWSECNIFTVDLEQTCSNELSFEKSSHWYIKFVTVTTFEYNLIEVCPRWPTAQNFLRCHF